MASIISSIINTVISSIIKHWAIDDYLKPGICKRSLIKLNTLNVSILNTHTFNEKQVDKVMILASSQTNPHKDLMEKNSPYPCLNIDQYRLCSLHQRFINQVN